MDGLGPPKSDEMMFEEIIIKEEPLEEQPVIKEEPATEELQLPSGSMYYVYSFTFVEILMVL